MDKKDGKLRKSVATDGQNGNVVSDDLINASGHIQELQRNFSLISLIGLGIVVGNVWPAVGGSILVALFNGGPPGEPQLESITCDCLTNSLQQAFCTNLLL